MKDWLRRLNVFCYRASSRAARHLGTSGRFLKALNTGVWLGVLDNEQLNHLTTLVYSGDSGYGDLQYGDHSFNAGGLTARELEPVQRFFERRSTVLVVGAGGGREVLALTRLGFTVHGFECNPKLVENGNAFLRGQGCPSRIEQTAPDECPPGSTRYDAILIGWGVYIHVIPRAKRQAFLRQVRACLVDRGRVLVGFCWRDAASPYFRRVAMVANAIRRVRGADPIELGDKLEPTFEHHFTVDEITEELATAGLTTHEYVDISDPGQALILAGTPEFTPRN